MPIGNAAWGDFVADSQAEMLNANRAVVGSTCLRTDVDPANGGTLFTCVALPSNDAGNWSLMSSVVSEVVGQTLEITATNQIYSGPGYFAGLNVTAYSGGPQTMVVRDSLDATGRILATFTVDKVALYPYAPPANSRVAFDIGLHVTITGGTSRSVAALVEGL